MTKRDSYGSMKAIIADQKAVSQSLKEAADTMTAAAEMMRQAGMASLDAKLRVQAPHSYRNDGSGDRPRMDQDQTHRPSSSPSTPRGLAGVRQHVTRMLEGSHGHMSGNTYEPVYGGVNGDVLQGHKVYSPSGSVTFAGAGEISDEELAAGARRSTVSKGTHLLRSGGATALLRAVPYVGIPLAAGEAVYQGFERFGQQREKNAQYQNIYGGTNMQGMGQRFAQEGFKLSQLFSGGLTGGQANQAFQGVSALGFQGAQRSQDLNFISSNYKSLGIGVAQSLELITTASKDLNTSLAGLKDGLHSVSQAAVGTGQSAAQAQARFSGTYSKLAGQFPGTGTAGVASNIATVTTGLGRGLSGLDITGMLTNPGQQAILAQRFTGGSLSKVQADIATGAPIVNQMLNYQIARGTTSFLTPQTSAKLNQLANQLPGGVANLNGQKDPSGLISTMADQLMSQMSGNEAQTLAAQIAATGVQVDNPKQAVMYAIASHFNFTNFTQLASQQQKQNNQRGISPTAPTVTPGSAPAFNGSGKDKHGRAGRGGPAIHQQGHNQNLSRTDPVIAAALSQLGKHDVVVKTPGGDRVVTMQEAVNAYPDQIAKGTARDITTGKSVKDQLGGLYEANYKGHDTTTQTVTGVKDAGTSDSSKKTSSGETVAAYDKNLPNNKKKNDKNTVTINLGPGVSQLFNVTGAGNVDIATAGAVNGVSPSALQYGH